jgi:eukaryotic-like serine/threonine-protein kinase
MGPDDWPPPGFEQALDRDELPVGARVGSYVVRRKLGAGGSGCVYLGEPVAGGASVAIKVLLGWLAGSPRALARFQREAELIAVIGHPNIVRVLEVGTLADERPYFVMELQTETLEALLRRRGRLPPSETLELLGPVCLALAAAHAAGVIHRDIKASNIAVGVQGGRPLVKLLDFGIAKLLPADPSTVGLTARGTRLGTPSAMAPEQVRGEAIDHRADIYALGVLAFRMLTGTYPFVASSAQEAEHLHLHAPPALPSRLAPVSPALEAVVLRCLEKAPEARFASVAELHEALRAAVEHVPAASADTAEEREAVAIFFGLRAGCEALEGPWTDVLDAAEKTLTDSGFQLPLQSGTALLAVRLLPPGAGAEGSGRREGLALACDLARRLGQHCGRGLDVTVCVHVGQARVSGAPGGPRIEGGSVLQMAEWMLVGDVDGVRMSQEVAAEMLRGA